jgi:hypothetical protein
VIEITSLRIIGRSYSVSLGNGLKLKKKMDLMTDRHMVIKTLLMQNLSSIHYLSASALHNNMQNLSDISPPTKVLPPCFCCPYACPFIKSPFINGVIMLKCHGELVEP